jgi:peptidoglycan/LPS O-acetylase OafA/YrhL
VLEEAVPHRRGTPRPSPPELRVLTSFRFFACLAVFLHHCVDFTTSPGDGPRSGLIRLFWEGWSGVAFFFILSGFILAYNYAGRLDGSGGTWRRGFYVSRFARIYPLYLLAFLVAAVAVIGQWGRAGIAGGLTAVSQVTLTQAFLPIHDPFDHSRLAALGFDGPAWSLSCEAFFYLTFPFLLVMLVRRRTSLLAVAAVGAWAWSVMLALEVRGTPFAGWVLYVFPPVRLAEFVVGVCGGLVFLRYRERLRGGQAWWTVAEICALVLVVTAVVLSFAVPGVLRYASYYVPFFAFVILVFAAERGLVSRHLRAPWLVFLGEISFAFYLLYVLVMRAAASLGLFSGSVPSIVVLGGVLAVTLAISAAVFVGYERPARTRVRGWLAPARTS